TGVQTCALPIFLVRQVSHVEIDHQVLSRQGIASAQVEVEILRDPVVDDVLVDVVITGGKIAYAGIEREPVAAEADIAHGAPARHALAGERITHRPHVIHPGHAVVGGQLVDPRRNRAGPVFAGNAEQETLPRVAGLQVHAVFPKLGQVDVLRTDFGNAAVIPPAYARAHGRVSGLAAVDGVLRPD